MLVKAKLFACEQKNFAQDLGASWRQMQQGLILEEDFCLLRTYPETRRSPVENKVLELAGTAAFEHF